MTIDGRLLEELDKAGEVKCFLIIGFQELVIDVSDNCLVLAFAKHRAVDIVLSVEFHKLSDSDNFLINRDTFGRWLLLPICVAVEQETKQWLVFIKCRAHTILLVFHSMGEIDQIEASSKNLACADNNRCV